MVSSVISFVLQWHPLLTQTFRADLTVEEHVRIFETLKGGRATADSVSTLVAACDLTLKACARSTTLSGGQKRKLQLAMMLAGGSAVCCVDEVSSGLDPLSRRKIWDILLAERGDRTIIITTHFLDEADYLSDEVVILSQGALKAQGSSTELKNRLGDGYSVHVPTSAISRPLPRFKDLHTVHSLGLTTFNVPDSADAARLLALLERYGIRDYRVSGPTLEDVFLKLTNSASISNEASGLPSPSRLQTVNQTAMRQPKACASLPSTPVRSVKVNLLTGRQTGPWQQMGALYRKRFLVLRRTYLPLLAACAVAMIGAGVSPLLLKHYTRTSCAPPTVGRFHSPSPELNLGSAYDLTKVAVGPESQVDKASLANFVGRYFQNSPSQKAVGAMVLMGDKIKFVKDNEEFRQLVSRESAHLSPGGYFLGDGSHPPTIAWAGAPGMLNPLLLQNLLSTSLSQVDIITSYSVFELPPRRTLIDFNPLLFVAYFVLVFACYPAFFALYPTVERVRKVRALQYSNGVRPMPLWLAHLLFDAMFVLLVSSISVLLLGVGSSLWYVASDPWDRTPH